MTRDQHIQKLLDARSRYFEATGKALAIDLPLSRLAKHIIEARRETVMNNNIIFIKSRGKQL